MTALGWWYLVAVGIGAAIGGGVVYLFCSNKRNKSHYVTQTKMYSPVSNSKRSLVNHAEKINTNESNSAQVP